MQPPLTPDQQRDLIVRARAGDRQALERLYLACEPLIKARSQDAVRQVSKFAPTWYDLDDLYQDAFLIFVDLVHHYDLEADTPFHGYLAAVMRQRLISHLQSKRAGQMMGPRLYHEAPTPPEDFTIDFESGNAPLPERWHCLADHPALRSDPPSTDHILAFRLLEALPTNRHKTIVAMFALFGYSHPEIAQHLGLSVQAIRRQYRRCLQYMQAVAEKRCPPALPRTNSYRANSHLFLSALIRVVEVSFERFGGRLVPRSHIADYGWTHPFICFACETFAALHLIAKVSKPGDTITAWRFTTSQERAIQVLKTRLGNS
jgi:RNA polymerase sigma factor (sigma-70 family)